MPQDPGTSERRIRGATDYAPRRKKTRLEYHCMCGRSVRFGILNGIEVDGSRMGVIGQWRQGKRRIANGAGERKAGESEESR